MEGWKGFGLRVRDSGRTDISNLSIGSFSDITFLLVLIYCDNPEDSFGPERTYASLYMHHVEGLYLPTTTHLRSIEVHRAGWLSTE